MEKLCFFSLTHIYAVILICFCSTISSLNAFNRGSETLFNDGFEPVVVLPDLIINEIDYDQPGMDTEEFIELYNAGQVPVNLSGISLKLVNGSNGIVYNTVVLPNDTVDPGGFYVICQPSLPTVVCDFQPELFEIQNGDVDAVALMQGDDIIDVISYEGTSVDPWNEGSGDGVIDIGSDISFGISRVPNGVDTDMNNADWSTVCITRGFANTAVNVNCE